jgi:hypothetical protein
MGQIRSFGDVGPMSGLPKAEIRMLFMSKRPRSSRTDRGAQVVPPAGVTVPPSLRESSSRVSSLLVL